MGITRKMKKVGNGEMTEWQVGNVGMKELEYILCEVGLG